MRRARVGVDELVSSIGGAFVLLGKRDRYVSAVSPIDEADSDAVTFCNKEPPEALQVIRDSRAGVVICPDELQFEPGDFGRRTLILVPDARLAFTRILRKLFTEPPEAGISATAVVDKAARIHPSAYIGPNSYIGACEIGENTVIYGSVHIYPDTVIGRNVVIHAGVVIGSESQGFHRNEKGELEKFPQVGRVVIEDDVEICANAAIMRGALGNTIIGQGTKIGPLCMVSHGVVIGRHVLVLGHSMLAGSSRVGDYSQVSVGACVKNGVEIGKSALVGLGAVVIDNVGDNKIVYGVPAREKEEWALMKQKRTARSSRRPGGS